MASITVVVTAHADSANLVRTLESLGQQSQKPDEIIALCSEIDLEGIWQQFPWVRFYKEPNLNDWGHHKRAKGLDLATSEYIAWFNHDDSYDQTFILQMMKVASSGADVVFCGWNKNSAPSFSSGQSTSGNYIAKASYARSAGYTDRHYEADGTFINRLAALGGKIEFLPKVLYSHNEVK
jgi:GT2 family glycosyltransferase